LERPTVGGRKVASVDREGERRQSPQRIFIETMEEGQMPREKKPSILILCDEKKNAREAGVSDRGTTTQGQCCQSAEEKGSWLTGTTKKTITSSGQGGSETKKKEVKCPTPKAFWPERCSSGKVANKGKKGNFHISKKGAYRPERQDAVEGKKTPSCEESVVRDKKGPEEYLVEDHERNEGEDNKKNA